MAEAGIERNKLIEDLKIVVADAEELLRATAEQIESRRVSTDEVLQRITSELNESLDLLRRSMLEDPAKGTFVFGLGISPTAGHLADWLQEFVRCYASIRFFLDRVNALGTAARSTYYVVPVPELPTSAQPILVRASIQSPGFLEFLASLNPLSILVQYLRERHERKKDNEYRNKAEQQKLFLENLILRNKALESTVQTLRLAGFSNSQIQTQLLTYIAEPVERLESKMAQLPVSYIEAKSAPALPDMSTQQVDKVEYK